MTQSHIYCEFVDNTNEGYMGKNAVMCYVTHGQLKFQKCYFFKENKCFSLLYRSKDYNRKSQ